MWTTDTWSFLNVVPQWIAVQSRSSVGALTNLNHCSWRKRWRDQRRTSMDHIRRSSCQRRSVESVGLGLFVQVGQLTDRTTGAAPLSLVIVCHPPSSAPTTLPTPPSAAAATRSHDSCTAATLGCLHSQKMLWGSASLLLVGWGEQRRSTEQLIMKRFIKGGCGFRFQPLASLQVRVAPPTAQTWAQ